MRLYIILLAIALLPNLPSFTISSQSKYEWLWPWPLEWVNVKYKYANGKACDCLCQSPHAIVCVINSTACHICHRLRDLHQLKYARHWSWPLEQAKVKYKYGNWKTTYDFQCVGNSNVCPICHSLRDNHKQWLLRVYIFTDYFFAQT